MASNAARFLLVNGIPHGGDDDTTVPPVSAFLESTPGAYTTTRTHGNASVVLFWEQHLRRLAKSVRILAECSRDPRSPIQSRGVSNASWDSIRPLVEGSLGLGLGLASGRRRDGEEMAITALVSGVDVYVHIGFYVPMVFGDGTRLAVVGRGREVAEAKYSEWARIRRYMEKLRPPLATELLLSNDGDQILEGSVTNFFVVCRKPPSNPQRLSSIEVQTAPVHDGVLPGVIRQLVIEVCSNRGIPVREVAPKWSDREFWEEAFVTNSLRLLQHVDMIQVPESWGELQLESWKQISWVEKCFGGPGTITMELQKAIMERASVGGYSINNFV